MKFAVLAMLLMVAAGAAIVLFVAFTGDSSSSAHAGVPTSVPSATPPNPSPTPLPRTWLDGLHDAASRTGTPLLVSCLDVNDDRLLDVHDAPDLAGLHIALTSAACDNPSRHRDFYEADTPAGFICDGVSRPLLLVLIASAGSDLLDPSSGESLGLLDVANLLQQRAPSRGVVIRPIITTAAVFGATQPQTSMERWIEHQVSTQLEDMPCLRAVLVGHSHGGVTVTSVTAVLDDLDSARMFGVLIDRTTKLYDRDATEMPGRTSLLNVFQTNEGWHGVRVDAGNVINIDESTERAPVALSDGGGGLALVGHKTLDDAPAVQSRIVDAILGWLDLTDAAH
jgi:hypothetical protein